MKKIAILGFGTVGMGIVEILNKRRQVFKNKIGQDINVKKVLVKNIEKDRQVKLVDGVLTDDIKEILEDKEIEIVIEVTSDLEESYENIKALMKAKKHIVTANKAIVSRYFEQLSSLAQEMQVAFLYEASVGGGIPLLKPLKKQIVLNNINIVEGILNGSCNYILNKMTYEDISYDKALSKAQALGYAEADPAADVSGLDSLRKLRILSTLILGGRVWEEDIVLRGIENISDFDIRQFEKRQFTTKLIGRCKREIDGFTAIVEPYLIKKGSYFDNVNAAYNSLVLEGEDIDELKFYGPGAGKLPTANAVLSDLLDIILGDYSVKSPLGDKMLENKNEKLEGQYYLRLSKLASMQDKDIAAKLNPICKEMHKEEEFTVVWTKNIRLRAMDELLDNIDKANYFLARIAD